MTKTELRKIYKEKRKAISSKDKLKYDDLILLQFQKLYFENVQILLTYWPMELEPNMQIVTSYIKHTNYALRVAYPVTNFSNNTMCAIGVEDDTSFTTNTFGLTEPINGEEIKANEIDIVFVPLFIFDLKGYRVGYGKGFYDKFLASCKNDVIKIGFCYFEPIEKIDDTNNFDIPLNYCITPHNIYEF
ncbi:MAG: 5-formyltetrahydrofolate cyclo-ligase [Chitinophagaceae bacterium]|nr:5-formyltetrahydrofolate cyclo-ligase [Chitinophagaceae bacterium]